MKDCTFGPQNIYFYGVGIFGFQSFIIIQNRSLNTFPAIQGIFSYFKIVFNLHNLINLRAFPHLFQ